MRDNWLKEHNLDDAKRAQLERYIKAQQKQGDREKLLFNPDNQEKA